MGFIKSTGCSSQRSSFSFACPKEGKTRVLSQTCAAVTTEKDTLPNASALKPTRTPPKKEAYALFSPAGAAHCALKTDITKQSVLFYLTRECS